MSIRLVTLLLVSISVPLAADDSGFDFVCFQWEVSCGCARQNVHLSEPKLIHGEAAVPYSWSMFVSIRLQGSTTHACGGTVLNESFVLTSATCIARTPIMGISISASAINTTVRRVDGVFIHPEYTSNGSHYFNDVAVLHLVKPLDLSNDSDVSRSCIAELLEFLPDPIYVPSAEAMLAVVGWGNTDAMQQALVYAANFSDADCPVKDVGRDLQFCAGREQRDAAGQYGFGLSRSTNYLSFV